MPEDPLRDIIDGVRTRLQDELEAQLRAVSERHQQALASERQRTQAEADARCAERLQALKAELDSVKVEHEERLSATVAAVRAETDHRAADQAARARQEMEQALAQTRRDFDAERTEWAAASAAAQSNGRLSEHADSLVRGLHAIDAATSLSDALAAIARAAAAEAPRAALFIANGPQLDEWAVNGVPSLSDGSLTIHNEDPGLVVEALTKGQPVRKGGSACAVPLMLDGAPVGVLYGEADADGGDTAPWSDSLEALARFGSTHLGYLTAVRTAQARQWLANGGGHTDETAVAAARRYARLVVSEIKLYNEAAVQAGRSRRDLLERLKPEIERARRLYEERVPASVAGRAQFFQQELVQTLAGGDPALLG